MGKKEFICLFTGWEWQPALSAGSVQKWSGSGEGGFESGSWSEGETVEDVSADTARNAAGGLWPFLDICIYH